MLDYRRTYARDRVQVRALIDEHKMGYDDREPEIGFVSVEKETDKLIGVSYAHKAIIIDPFICEVPIAALKLFLLTQGAISQAGFSNMIVQINEDNKKFIDELGALGFERILNKYAVFKKVI